MGGSVGGWETDLAFGGVDVDIDVGGRKLEGEVDERVGVVGEDGRIHAF